MKKLLVWFVIAFSITSVTGQTLLFYPNEVRGLNKIFTLKGSFGQSTEVKNLWLTNRTRQTLRIYASPHVDGEALYFTNEKTITSRNFSLQLAPGARGALQLFGYLDEGSARTCRGHLALAATPINPDGSKGQTRTVKLPVALTFAAPKSNPAQKPARDVVAKPACGTVAKPNRTAEVKPDPSALAKPNRYEAVMHEGLPMRRHLHQLPLQVYSDHARTGDNALQYEMVARSAIEIWNNAGRQNGMTRDFFKIVQKRGQADIRIDWTGTQLLPGAQGTAYPSEGIIGMLPLQRYRDLGLAGKTLLHELCHMLGVAHSELRGDTMYDNVRSLHPELSKLSVSTRDRQMLAWLYKQTRYAALGE